jgi:hypothetical protein
MTGVLNARIAKLEGKLPQPEKPGRVIRLVAGDEQEAEARRLLEAEGWNPDSGEIGFIRLIAVSPGPGHPRYSELSQEPN